ncbi:MAG: hypothetical protein LAO78_24170 [Acidobacteriia bacterium]|nr:hypothetical protein [Terriglobia bacterium]
MNRFPKMRDRAIQVRPVENHRSVVVGMARHRSVMASAGREKRHDSHRLDHPVVRVAYQDPRSIVAIARKLAQAHRHSKANPEFTRYAAVLEKEPESAWQARHGLTAAQY